MPVVRLETVQAGPPPLSSQRRQSLVERLAGEIRGTGDWPAPLPVIFETPFEALKKIDVLVVWEEWRDVRPDDRTEVILDAYGEERQKVSQAMGVTYQEAMQQQLLPYAIEAQNEANEELLQLLTQNEFPQLPPVEVKAKVAEVKERIRKAKLGHGGIEFPDGTVELRFPTLAMATSARERLIKKCPEGGYWSHPFTP
ncbi:MAG: hypothetical protein ABSG86_01070 [Thermoguttaceae bacterium]|jgi:hypothetical protein